MGTQPLDTPSELGLPVGSWHAERDQSRIGFTVKTMWGLATVSGRFTRFDGHLRIHTDGAAANLAIEAASLDTGHAKRDQHLRSADFFDVAEHPSVSFVATAITARAGDGLTIIGDLAVAGRSIRVELPVEVARREQGRLGLTTTATVSREQAGMTWNRAGMIRGDALLTVELELTADRDGADPTSDVVVDVA
jgi:polyisoprenoid-binding protein YceI